MPSPSPVSSAATSQTVCSEEVTNQALMKVIVDLQAQLTSLSRQQNELMELVTDLRRELNMRAEPLISAPSAIARSSPEPASILPLINNSTRSVPAPVRRIRREPAFYHISNEEEAPWKAPGGYHPYRDSSPPTRGKLTAERSGCPSHPRGSRQRVPDSFDEGARLPPIHSPSSFRLPAQQGSHSSLPSIESMLNLPPLTFPPAPTPNTRLLGREPAFYHISSIAGTPFVTPGPGIFQPPPYPSRTAPLPPPKRKRVDDGDVIDDDEALDKKRSRRPSTDDVD